MIYYTELVSSPVYGGGHIILRTFYCMYLLKTVFFPLLTTARAVVSKGIDAFLLSRIFPLLYDNMLDPSSLRCD